VDLKGAKAGPGASVARGRSASVIEGLGLGLGGPDGENRHGSTVFMVEDLKGLRRKSSEIRHLNKEVIDLHRLLAMKEEKIGTMMEAVHDLESKLVREHGDAKNKIEEDRRMIAELTKKVDMSAVEIASLHAMTKRQQDALKRKIEEGKKMSEKLKATLAESMQEMEALKRISVDADDDDSRFKIRAAELIRAEKR
jgi:chromosome segregation ATPase